MGLVKSNSLGGKGLIHHPVTMEIQCFDKIPAKRQCSSEESFFTSDKSVLEALPQDVLIRILCGVEHDDLKSLFFVSKSIREVTLIAKHWHFAYRTPKKTLGFLNAIDMENLGEFNEIGKAPKRVGARLRSKKLAEISVAWFSSAGEGKI